MCLSKRLNFSKKVNSMLFCLLYYVAMGKREIMKSSNQHILSYLFYLQKHDLIDRDRNMREKVKLLLLFNKNLYRWHEKK